MNLQEGIDLQTVCDPLFRLRSLGLHPEGRWHSSIR